MWDTTDHFSAAIETRVGENTRFRIQAFDRKNTDLSHINPSPCPGPFGPSRTSTFERDYSKGVQFIAQRRSANRLSGWIGYTLVYARERLLYRNQITRVLTFTDDFSTFEDQRHSLNTFATYRLKPSINLSGKFLYGSGFPVSASLEQGPGGTLVPAPVMRLSAYLRTDFRVDKSWAFSRWKLTLYGEVLNMTDHSNRIVTSTSFLPNGGILATTAQALPITPTAGLAFEF